MPPSIPQILVPYLSDRTSGSLLLVTSVLNTPANWLVANCISAVLREDQVSSLQGENDQPRVPKWRGVILLSFLRPLSLWVEVGKKAGLDVPTLLANGRLSYIDGLNVYGSFPSSNSAVGTFATRSHAVKDVQNALEHALSTISRSTRTTGSAADATRTPQEELAEPVLIIDGIDFLNASQPTETASTISQMLNTVRQRVHSAILVVSSDGPLLQGTSGLTTPLEQEHQAFVTTLAHQARLVMQLRALDTGTAKDISGVIRVSHGSAYEDDPGAQSLEEGEWLYKISGDGGIRIWAR